MMEPTNSKLRIHSDSSLDFCIKMTEWIVTDANETSLYKSSRGKLFSLDFDVK